MLSKNLIGVAGEYYVCKDGSIKKDPGFRWFDFKYFTQEDKARENDWLRLGFC